MIPQPIDQVPLFLRLSDDERELISSRLHHLEFNTNDIIFNANKAPEMLGVIVQGWVKLESESPQGRIALANLGAGSVIGEVDVLLNRPHSTTARAASATIIHALYRQDLQDLILECPTIGLKFSHGLGTRVAYLDEYLVTQRLSASALLGALGEEELRAIAGKLQFCSFQRGETVFEAGDTGEAVYLIEEGAARLIAPSRDGESFEEMKEGEIFGQTALITGKPNLATARAVSDLGIWNLTRADYQELIRDYPTIKIAFSRALAEGLSADDQAKAVEQLRTLPLFTDVDEEALQDLAGCLVLRHFPAGELIYAEGTSGDAMYFVESGEVRLVSDAAGQAGLMERKGEGESFGEMALLTGRTRAEAAKALDDTTVWVLYKSDYDDLIVRHPTLSLALSRALSSKLGDTEGEYVEQHLQRLRLFSGLSQSELKQVGEFVKPLRFRAGETICFAGQPAEYIYLIESGEVREIAGGPNGQVVVLNLLAADQSFGERAVFQSSTYRATMQSVADVDCWSIAKPDFDRLIARYPALALNVARQIAEDAERVTTRSGPFELAPALRSNGNGSVAVPKPPVRQASVYASPPRPPREPLPRPSVVSRAPALAHAAPAPPMAPAVGVRTAPSKPWERSSNSVMRPMPAATTRPIAVGSSAASVMAAGAPRPIRTSYTGESITARFAEMSTSAKVKMVIVAFFAFWLLVVLPFILILTLLLNSSSFMGLFSSNTAPSQQLPENLDDASPKVSGFIPGVAKLAVRERTATPTARPPTAAPKVKAKPTAKPAAKKPLVSLKAGPKPTAPPPSATPTNIAEAAAVRPPLPPRIWDNRLGSPNYPMLSGVGVTEANVQSGQTFWRLVKMQFQDAGVESGNDHTIYISIIDENGQRVSDQTAVVSWDQSGSVEIQHLGLADQKPQGDYCNCNYNWPMYGAGYRVKVDGALPSDEAYGMIMPEHRHVNYLLTFQRVVMP